MLPSKKTIKYIHSLKNKKGRSESGTFVAEGKKIVSELLDTFKCQILIGTNSFLNSKKFNAKEVYEVTESELERISFLKTPQQVLAVFYQPVYTIENNIKNLLSLVLDSIQDPGNLGTIIRLADWYGVENIFCSKDSADIYNPKTVQATMGAIARIRIHYIDLVDFFENIEKDIPVYGTFLDGKDLYRENISENGIIVMGNEGNGISQKLEKYIKHKLYIPNYPIERETSESLNVAIATAIICAEFRRKLL